MPAASPTETLHVHYKFDLDDDDSGGPSGPDYAIITMTPRKSDLKNPILREMDITLYLKEDTSVEISEQLVKLLNENVSWAQFVLPKR